MLTLEDITTYPFVYFSYLKHTLNECELSGLKLISDEQLNDYQQLKDFIESCSSSMPGYDFLKNQLDSVIGRVEKANVKGVNPEKFFTNGYEIEDMNNTDKVIDGSRLIIYNPLIGINKIIMILKNRSIEEIKQLISHTTPEGKNALTFMLRGIGETKLQNVLFALNFYEDQVKRQYDYYGYIGQNLFDKDKLAKLIVLTSNPEILQEFIEYIIMEKPQFVWGKLSDSQIDKLQKFLTFSNKDLELLKKLLYSKITQSQSFLLTDLKKPDYLEEYANFIYMIADYITLKEAQEGLVKTRTIDRFIIK